MVESKPEEIKEEKVLNYFEADETISALKLMKVNQNEMFELELKEKIQISHDTYKFVFRLPEENWVAGLSVGSHMILTMKNDSGKDVTHKYTPVSPVTQTGTIDFIIKIYRKTEQFPDGGKLTPLLESLQIGQKLEMEGPVGNLRYKGNGVFERKKQEVPGKKMNIGFLAGGTGITPCLQIIQACSLAKEDTKLRMIFSNKTFDDILCLQELEHLTNLNPNFKVTHTLTREQKPGFPNQRVSKELVLQAELPPPSDSTFILICGPKDFHTSCKQILSDMGYSADMFYEF